MTAPGTDSGRGIPLEQLGEYRLEDGMKVWGPIPVVDPDGRIIAIYKCEDGREFHHDVEEEWQQRGLPAFPFSHLPEQVQARRWQYKVRTALREGPPTFFNPVVGEYYVWANDEIPMPRIETEGWHLKTQVAGNLQTGEWIKELTTGRDLIVLRVEAPVIYTFSKEALLDSGLPKPWKRGMPTSRIWRKPKLEELPERAVWFLVAALVGTAVGALLT